MREAKNNSFENLKAYVFALTLNVRIVFEDKNTTMDAQTLKERVALVRAKREYLLNLLEKPNLGTLKLDVNQALDEMDDLIDEFRRTFPDPEII